MSKKEHFLITNRNVHGTKIQFECGQDRDICPPLVQALKFGRFNPSKEKKPTLDYEIYVTEADEVDSYRDALNQPKEKLGATARFFRELYEAMEASQKDALIVVHGFKHTVERLMITMGLIQEGYINQKKSNIGHLIAFSWPARDKVQRYEWDQQDAQDSGESLGQFFEKLHNFAELAIVDEKAREKFLSRFNLLAMSMGNRVLQYSLDYIKDHVTSSPEKPLLQEVIHTGADVDIDVYEDDAAMYGLLKLAKRVHVYYTALDDILGLSVGVNGKERLGRYGKTIATETEDLVLVDVSVVAGLARAMPSMCISTDIANYPTQHAYATTVRALHRDLAQILSHKKTHKIDSRASMGDGRWLLEYAPIAKLANFS